MKSLGPPSPPASVTVRFCPGATIAALSCVLLTKVVGLGLPFQFTTEPDTKPEPLTASERPAPPATVLDGDSEVATGTGGGTNTTVTAGLVAARVEPLLRNS